MCSKSTTPATLLPAPTVSNSNVMLGASANTTLAGTLSSHDSASLAPSSARSPPSLEGVWPGLSTAPSGGAEGVSLQGVGMAGLKV